MLGMDARILVFALLGLHMWPILAMGPAGAPRSASPLLQLLTSKNNPSSRPLDTRRSHLRFDLNQFLIDDSENYDHNEDNIDNADNIDNDNDLNQDDNDEVVEVWGEWPSALLRYRLKYVMVKTTMEPPRTSSSVSSSRNLMPPSIIARMG